MITLIVAMDKNGLIGADGIIPWHYFEDMKWFKEQTKDSICVMGRKTWDSIPGGLPGRVGYILTSNPKNVSMNNNYLSATSFQLKSQIMQWIHHYDVHFNKDTYIIGGAQIYKEFLDVADRLLITHIDKEFKGDTYFPLSMKELKENYDSMVIKESGDLTFIEYFKKEKSEEFKLIIDSQLDIKDEFKFNSLNDLFEFIKEYTAEKLIDSSDVELKFNIIKEE